MAARALDCTRCGACCCNADENRREGYPYYIPIEQGDGVLEKPELVRRYVVHDDEGAPHMKLDVDHRCLALSGGIGRRVRCLIYADRPRTCRRLQEGTPRCLQYRRERGVDR